jgi:preprotein translocase subunit SecA
MLDFLTKGLTKVFGTKSDRDIKDVLPLVEQINAEYAKLPSLSNDELRGKTDEIVERINTFLKPVDEQIAQIQKHVNESPDMDLHEKESNYNQIDELEKERNEQLEVVLLEVLPETFAIVKDTARRFMDNATLTATATMFDKKMAGKYAHVNLEGDQVTWNNSWDAAGTEVTWSMLHYDVQLIGGVQLHRGKVAEMATGEGKTLVATLPAFLNALAKRGVHVVTVNDYLAKRDAAWMAPIFQFHGLSIDCIDNYEANSPERREAYRSDIVYGTNNEFGFDYLRDNMTRETKELVQSKHHFAMIDEVDSVLIDEARTPLIISGPVPKGDEHEFHELKPRVEKLVAEQRKIVGQYLIDAKRLIKEGDEKEGGLALFRAFRGFPKHKPLIKFLSETGMRLILQKTENNYLADNSKLMPEADEPLFFVIEEKNNNIDLTEKGIDLITKDGEDPEFFILPDIGVEIAKIENDTNLSENEILTTKDVIIKDYAIKAERIHTINQLLKAYSLFEKDTEYIVVDSKVKIVDEQTGRVMDGRRYSDGLHQAIEAKENVKVEDATQTYATITLQNYFRMYHKLSGMTGTAETEAGELWDIYKLDTVVIPTNKPIVRDDRQDKVYKTVREKFNAVTEEIVEMSQAGRPILVGTTSVEISEILSRMLNMRKIKHQVLNAKQHAKEADVVAEAGKPGTVTIATNMAGRGTDIKLTPESKAAGGLAIIGTERHESRRVDRQLRGRSGRQGDPGSSQFFVSLEDNLMRLFGSDRIAKLMDRMGLEEGEVIQHSMISKSIERAQKKVEENNFGTRKRLLEYDDVMNSQREVIYKRRKNALYGERLQLDIMNMMFDTCEDIINNAKAMDAYDDLRLSVLSMLGIDFEISADEFKATASNVLSDKLYKQVYENYKRKNDQIREKALPILKEIYKTNGATVKDIRVPFTDQKKQIAVVTNLEKNIENEGKDLILSMEKICTLAIIDENWKEHLREMDDLKQSVQNAVYEQKDPLLIYKFEGFELFKRFIGKLNEDTVSFLMKLELPVQDSSQVTAAATQRQRQRLQESKAESASVLSGGGSKNRPPVEKQMPIKSEKVVGRNDKVSVQYADGTVKKDVKFKTVEEDIKGNKCVLIDE